MTESLLHWILYGGAIGLIVIGAIGIVTAKHLFRVVLALAIAEAGANLMLVIAGLRPDAVAPILTGYMLASQAMVDPVPQAMVLTAIVIGVGIQALALSLLIMVYGAYGTLDVTTLRERMADEIDTAVGVTADASHDRPAGKRQLGTSPAAISEEAS